jgi:hypothetical protein
MPRDGKKLKAPEKEPATQATVTFKKLYTFYPRLDDLGIKKIKGA